MTRNKKLFSLLIGLMLVVMTPTACSTASSGTSNFPTGKFVSAKDKAVAIKYNADGTFEFYFAGKDPVFVGKYTVKGNLITTVNPSETDPNCQGPSTYQWSFDGEKLTFAPNGEDSCKQRRDANADIYILEK